MTDANPPELDEPELDEPDDFVGDVHRATIDAAQVGERIDAAIAALFSMSRAVAQRLIDDGLVTIDGTPVGKAGQRLKLGNAIEVMVPAPAPIELVPEDIPLAVLYEDHDIIVIDKPAGLVVHPAPGHPRGTLVNAVLFHCKDLQGIGGELRPGIVHRLDKDTSGVMVVAKNEAAHAGLTAAFAAKSRGEPGSTIVRDYLGIASPPPPGGARGVLKTLHARHPSDRKRFSTKVMWGKTAITAWERVEALGEAALLRFSLQTGRTHQIRVHAADHGWPLLGDQLYGKASKLPPPLAEIAARLGRQALHAATLDFDHPVTGVRVRNTSPIPADFAAALDALRALATRSST